MNWMCMILGHKWITAIYDGKWDSEAYTKTMLNEPICKRCGIKLNSIQTIRRYK